MLSEIPVLISLTPIGQTYIDWTMLQRVTQVALKRSVTRILDSKNITARGMPEAIATYGEFQQQHVDYAFTLREAGSLLRHFSVSFLVLCGERDLLFQIAIDGDLKILDCGDSDKVSIVTATLEQWRTTIINYATHRATSHQREFSFYVLREFDKMGLGKILDGYARSGGPELLLTEKR